ncbi:Phosducin-like protein 3 [Nowakowskiella sp. JEL0407]|nr:Phosducin-like protein 3 [Nowakowskiella sp. JEL0407]
MSDLDARILAALSNPDAPRERAYEDENSDKESLHSPNDSDNDDYIIDLPLTRNDLPPALANILSDQQIRDAERESKPQPAEEYVVSNSNNSSSKSGKNAYTGPKGVLDDYKFHKTQEKLREDYKKQVDSENLNKTGLKSGWMQRQIRAEELEKQGSNIANNKSTNDVDDADELIRKLELEEELFLDEFDSKEKNSSIRSGNVSEQVQASATNPEFAALRAKRLLDLNKMLTKPRFGVFREISVSDYVYQIDSAPPNVNVVLHLYQQSHDACRLLNSILTVLAKKYPTTKFLRIVAEKADPDMDFDVSMPTLLVYRNGELVNNLVRFSDEIKVWRETGRCGVDEVEKYFCDNGITSEEDLVDDF